MELDFSTPIKNLNAAHKGASVEYKKQIDRKLETCERTKTNLERLQKKKMITTIVRTLSLNQQMLKNRNLL